MRLTPVLQHVWHKKSAQVSPRHVSTARMRLNADAHACRQTWVLTWFPSMHRADMSLLPALAAFSGHFVTAAAPAALPPTGAAVALPPSGGTQQSLPAGVNALVCPGTSFPAPPTPPPAPRSTPRSPRAPRATLRGSTLTFDYNAYMRPLPLSAGAQTSATSATWSGMILYNYDSPSNTGQRFRGRPSLRNFVRSDSSDGCITRTDIRHLPLFNDSFSQFDVDRDGKICEVLGGTEWDNMYFNFIRPQVFASYDLNNDGLLNGSEFDNAFKFRLSDIDLNRDGLVSQDEAESHWRKYSDTGLGQLHSTFSEVYFPQLDLDKSGYIDPGSEFEQAFNYGVNPPGARLLELPAGWGDDQVYLW